MNRIIRFSIIFLILCFSVISFPQQGTSNLFHSHCTNTHQAIPYYAGWVKKCNRKLTDQDCWKIAHRLVHFSAHYQVDARLMTAIIMTESDFRPTLVSRKGAMGLGQLMPVNAREMSVKNPYDITENLGTTTRLIRGHILHYYKKTGDMHKSLVLGLAAYNAGSGNVRKYGGVPPFKETQNYIRKILSLYKSLSGINVQIP